MSCSDDDNANFFFEFVPADNVTQIPDNFVVDQIDTLLVEYRRPTTCHSFNGFDVSRDGTSREITLVTKVVNIDSSCEDLVDDVRVVPLVFRPEEAGEVELRFFNGLDQDNNPMFLTINIPILD